MARLVGHKDTENTNQRTLPDAENMMAEHTDLLAICGPTPGILATCAP